MPIAAMVILLGGLAALIGAFWLYQSGQLAGTVGSAVPAAATPGSPSDPGAPPAAPADAGTPPRAPADAGTPPRAPADAGSPSGTGSAAKPPAAVETRPGTAAPAAAVAVAPPAGAPAAVAAPPAPPPPPPPPPFEKTYECRKYAAFKIDPDTAIVTVDGEIIGIADEWADTPRTKKWEFEKEGVHYVKLSHRDYKTIWLRFIVSEKADDKTAEVELEMKKADKDDKDEKKKDDKKKEEKKDEKK